MLPLPCVVLFSRIPVRCDGLIHSFIRLFIQLRGWCFVFWVFLFFFLSWVFFFFFTAVIVPLRRSDVQVAGADYTASDTQLFYGEITVERA